MGALPGPGAEAWDGKAVTLQQSLQAPGTGGMTEQFWLGTRKFHVIYSHLLAKPHSQAREIYVLTPLLGEVSVESQTT